jgi:ferritin
MANISPKLVNALNKQANQEFAMSCGCEVHHSSGFAKFFHEQVAEEQGHAGKILKHLADREEVPAIGPLTDVAKAVYDLERAKTSGIHAAYETALAEQDYPAQVLLHWFISEQVEEEAWSDKLLAKTREATCAGALSSLDRHLPKILFADAATD